MKLPPLSLYVHMPWCVRKCPYCDFNSHAASREGIPEAAYINALVDDLDADLARLPAAQLRQRPLQSIFIGGGTPSLISPAGYVRLLQALRQRLLWADDIEITLEANPGTLEQGLFAGYRAAGINRLSIGVQSFQNAQLQALGRVHGGDEARRAAQTAREAGFDNFNLDLMHGLPGQDVAGALDDLAQALDLAPTHLSWYQLTLEPNTVFYRQRPVLPDEEVLADIQAAGQDVLTAAGFAQYEVSAYARAGRQARHNLNYWTFGDYLGIGAGAHGKLTLPATAGLPVIVRTQKTRLPADYLAAATGRTMALADRIIPDPELPFEFMLNVLRLRDGVPGTTWQDRTGRSPAVLTTVADRLRAQELLVEDPGRWQASELGYRFLNRVVDAFLP